MNAVDIANAALMEVGEAPVFFVDDETGRPRMGGWFAEDVHLKAVAIGMLAEHGPDAPIRCRLCAYRWETHPPCIPVRDALRGMTCGAS